MAAEAPAIQRVNPLDDPHWDERVAALGGASFFHTAAWARVLQETYQFRPIYFVQKQPDGALASVVPLMEVNSWITGRRGISLPFTDECEPLSTHADGLQPVFGAIANHANARGWKYWELRGGNAALGAPASVAFHGHSLSLCGDVARMLAGCAGAVRWAIRKAELTELKISFAHDLESVRAFHELVCTTRKRHGLPPQPRRFFESIHRHVIAPGHGCVVLARLGDKPVAGSMFFHFGKSALFKFGASDAAFHHLHSNNLVMWRAIEWHTRAGFDTLDFGRTSIANKGLRHFKLGWGTTERRIEYARFDRRTARFVSTPDQSSGWHNSVIKLLPSALARALGAAAYKHVA